MAMNAYHNLAVLNGTNAFVEKDDDRLGCPATILINKNGKID